MVFIEKLRKPRLLHEEVIKLCVYYSCKYFKGTEISIALNPLTHFVWCLYWIATHQKDYSLHNTQQRMESRWMDEQMWGRVYV